MDRNDELAIPLTTRRRFRSFVLIYLLSILSFGLVSEALRLLIRYL